MSRAASSISTASRRQLAILSLTWLATVVLSLSLCARLAQSENHFPLFCDEDTAGLWLFDEPVDPAPHPLPEVRAWYYTQTVTDASANYYDLHRLNGGAIEEGRFGRALRIRGDAVGPGMNLAANYASEPRTYGVFLPADHEFVPRSDRERDSAVNFFWYTVRPDKLVNSLRGDEWTIEFWLKLARPIESRVCLIDAGQGRSRALRLELDEQAQALLLEIRGSGIDVACPLGSIDLAEWRHVALQKPAHQHQVAVMIDGKQISSTAYKPIPPAPPTLQTGLVARTYQSTDFNDSADSKLVADLGGELATAAAGAKSIRLRGWVRAPFTGDVRFELDPSVGGHVDVDERPLIYGWYGRAAMYRRSPRWGVASLIEGQHYPVLIELQRGEGEPDLAEQRLYWSWPGAERQPVPAAAWFHSSADVEESDDDVGGGFDPVALMTARFNLTLGSDRDGQEAIDGWLDELRVSSVARYEGNFSPVTHSFNYGDNSPQPAEANGPPPLKVDESGKEPASLGSRKHLFIDDLLLAEQHDVHFVVNRPHDPEAITPEMSAGDHSFFDLEGAVALFAPAGYEGREDFANLLVSDDGLHFTPKNVDAGADGSGTKPRPIATGVPAWGRMALDANPLCPAWARFKFTAGVPHRGIYLLASPDAIHWRRNETIMLQVGTGGESHWYWDDQQGRYRYLLKWDHGPGGRQSVESTTRDFYEPWPLAESGDPSKDLATPLGYLKALFPPDEKLGEVYRCRAAKYLWAPDAYFAFLWRFDRETQARQVELAVSRDGTQWKFFRDDWYMPAEFDFQGNDIHEVTSVEGLIRRGDEIWQYADYSTGRHDGRAPHWRVRLKQRLDGFVSLDAGATSGQAMTKPLTFEGDQLQLNLAAKGGGFVKVALLEVNGKPISGFGVDDCIPADGNSVHHTVSWRDGHSVRQLAGRPIRVMFQMQNAKLFAMQFQ